MIAAASNRIVADVGPADLLKDFEAVRRTTDRLAGPLSAEDCLLQSMPDASPTKWHLAHTSWFFETFLLAAEIPGYLPASAEANYLFNSYYNAIGERIARDRRGMLSRPSLDEVRRYRGAIDRRMGEFLSEIDASTFDRIKSTLVLGLNHEQQHQELILTDIKHAFGTHPLRPAYHAAAADLRLMAPPIHWIDGAEGIVEIGHEGPAFHFDNELPRHRAWLEPHQIASRPATVGEYREFIDAGGYERPEFWLSDGWAARKARAWEAPMYWERQAGDWKAFTLAGLRPLIDAEPVTHVSFYEADAFARWSGARLPTEVEWESLTDSQLIAGNFLDSGRLHPQPAAGADATQLFGDVWEWTASPYIGYPGYRAASGALGEYNGKFMCNQFVLRGGSCASSASHLRATYRNFFPPDARWQFSGVRLAR